jgi:uncharacterized protein
MYGGVVQFTIKMYNDTNMIKRKIERNIEQYLDSDEQKILFIWGPRRSGKTTLLKQFAKKNNQRIFNFDFVSDQEFFKPDRNVLDKIAKQHDIIFIDEVQNYDLSSKVLKLLHDEYKIKIIATGSSELRQKGQDFDSLTGRYNEIFCLPLTVEEVILNNEPKSYELENVSKTVLEDFIRWGSYPEVYLTQSEEQKIGLLENIFETYVLKDVVSIYNLKDNKLAKEILQKIALQIGSEVSIREIANSLGANIGTVSNYLEIFCQNHVIIALPSFKTNLRRAISENKKYYFYDLGIRNAMIRDFRPLDLRQDKGSVFENFIISELYKKKKIDNILQNFYFYREYSGKEVDLVIEDYQKRYKTYEIKLHKKTSKSVFPLDSDFASINAHNYTEIFLTD